MRDNIYHKIMFSRRGAYLVSKIPDIEREGLISDGVVVKASSSFT